MVANSARSILNFFFVFAEITENEQEGIISFLLVEKVDNSC